VTTVPRTTDPSRDLLFGLLALQTGLINQVQLVAAFHAWTQAGPSPTGPESRLSHRQASGDYLT
jgi:hypothetical protein